jgi:hypothetical protein
MSDFETILKKKKKLGWLHDGYFHTNIVVVKWRKGSAGLRSFKNIFENPN